MNSIDERLDHERQATLGQPPLLYLLPILGLFKINVVGDLFFSEPIIILLFALAISRGQWRIRNLYLRPIMWLGLIWLAAQIVTDFAAHTPIDDRLRGTAKISLFIIEIFVLDKMISNSADALKFLIGLAVSFLIRPFLDFGEDNSIEDSSGFNLMWKFGIGYGLFIAFSIPLLFKTLRNPSDRNPIRGVAINAALIGSLSFFFNARSLAGILLLTSIFLFISSKANRSAVQRTTFLIPMIGAIIAAQAISSIYMMGASSGIFGIEAKTKYEDQYSSTSSGILEILGGGRSEFLVSTEAIKDSPLLGHGSWAKDYKYTALYIELQRENLNRPDFDSEIDVRGGLIPSHSHILGAWVEAGILGALFWFSVISLCLFKAAPGALRLGGVVGTISIMFLPWSLWNFIFSPFGGHVRLSTAFLIVVFSIAANYDLKDELNRNASQHA